MNKAEQLFDSVHKVAVLSATLAFLILPFLPQHAPPPAAEISKTSKADEHSLTFPCVLMHTVLTVISHAAVCALCMVHGPCVANRKMTPG